MSDVPYDGWWLAANGRWYPPETHPAFNPPGPMAAPAGWFQDEDGTWLPPHLRVADTQFSETDLTEPAAPAPPRRSNRWRPSLVAAWALVVVIAGGIGLALASSDDPTPTKVDAATTIRPLEPPAEISSDDTTTTTTSTTTSTTTTTIAPTVPVPPGGP